MQEPTTEFTAEAIECPPDHLQLPDKYDEPYPDSVPECPPNHLQLPDKDGEIVTNFQENPQSILLTGCLTPRLDQLHPDGQYLIGSNTGIYWRNVQPPLDGCKAPDWFYVPGVSPMLDGKVRRSYVLWNEGIRPLLAIEFVSGNASEEHDTTPRTGKYWVYEQGICIPYYAIFDGWRGTIELFAIQNMRYEPVTANDAGRYPILPLRVELGLWQARYRGMDGTWLRVWDCATGEMLPSYEERAEIERHSAEAERVRAEAERVRAEAERVRAENAESLAKNLTHELVEQRKRAEAADQEAQDLRQQLEQLNERLRAMGLNPPAL